jgi:hypothetical protein
MPFLGREDNWDIRNQEELSCYLSRNGKPTDVLFKRFSTNI